MIIKSKGHYKRPLFKEEVQIRVVGLPHKEHLYDTESFDFIESEEEWYKYINDKYVKCKSCKEYKHADLFINLYKQDNKATCQACRNNKVRKYTMDKYNSDPDFKLRMTLRARLYGALRSQNARKESSIVDIIGCTIQELRCYLSDMFTDGMTWENYGIKGWHVDHIKPCASYDLTDPNQQRECFHYTNLQPLWAKDNIRKGAKYNI